MKAKPSVEIGFVGYRDKRACLILTNEPLIAEEIKGLLARLTIQEIERCQFKSRINTNIVPFVTTVKFWDQIAGFSQQTWLAATCMQRRGDHKGGDQKAQFHDEKNTSVRM